MEVLVFVSGAACKVREHSPLLTQRSDFVDAEDPHVVLAVTLTDILSTY